MTTTIRTRDEGQRHAREMLIDDQVISSLAVIDGLQRIGTATVSMAGIGGVETHPKHRMKGYMRTLFEDTLRYIHTAGYDVSLLFGIPDFYHKFGYAVCLPDMTARIDTRNAELARPFIHSVTIRPVRQNDLPAIIDLYNRTNNTRNCSIVRNPECFTSLRVNWWDRSVVGFVLEDGPGHFAGYVLHEDSRQAVYVIELACTNPRLYANVLYECALQAIEKRCGQISFDLPCDHPFAEYLQRYDCEWTIKYRRQSGGMMRIVNQATLMEKIRPELDRRIARVAVLPPPITLTLRTELGDITLPLGKANGAAATLEFSQDRLMQLIAGYRSTSDLLSDPQVTGSGSGISQWLDILFPRHEPWVWMLDGF